ncbi:MAG: hypothetical protein MUF83_04450 [Acidimicrobiales bacterium]|nr:hypothetical protein [Acidimicrobiales bacterium]
MTEEIPEDGTTVSEVGCGPRAIVVAIALVVSVAIMVGPWATTDPLAEGWLFVVGALSGALFVVGGVLVRRGRAWGDFVSLGALLGLLVGGAFVLAQPGGRHPIAMSLVGGVAVGLGVAPARRLSERVARIRSALAITAWVGLCLLFVAGAQRSPSQ